MIWLTWRQHRLQLLFIGVSLGVLVLSLGVSGVGIASTFRNSGLASCLSVPGRDCGLLSSRFQDQYSKLQFLIPLFLILPALIGAFVGAPLVAREVEQGTHRLAWTQGVTRVRWLIVKIAVLSVAILVAAALFTWVLNWWSRPLVVASDTSLNPGAFDLRGTVPIGYTVFALALGIAAGTVIRRTIPAMVTTIAAYGALRGVVALWLRQRYATPLSLSYSVLGNRPRSGSGDWVLSTKTVDGAGRFVSAGDTLDFNLLSHRCPALLPGKGFPNQSAVEACVRQTGLHVVALYQPGSRYWTFQGIETALFCLVGIALLGFSVWWVSRRIA
jgi:hypothetical protein